jgi:cell wall-associated NlpC family hydrolase
MQFLPATFARYGVDGENDGRADITDPADSAMSAANYLTAAGVAQGPAGVRRALYTYNHAYWYVNDVLYYAHAYGGGTLLGDPTDCGPTTGSATGNPALPPLTSSSVTSLLRWAQAQLGDPYVYGANGPNAWDCSSYTRGAYAHVGITLPRTAQAQRDWLAAGNGYRVPLGQERPGDLVFTDTYLGPARVGHVMIVFNPATRASIEAVGSHVQYDHYTRYRGHHIFEIWRVGNLADHPTRNGRHDHRTAA